MHFACFSANRRQTSSPVAGIRLADCLGIEVVMFHQMTARIGVACAALALSGCYAYAEPPVVYAEAYEAPVEIDVQTYPQAQYEGRPVYLYRDRWYYRD